MTKKDRVKETMTKEDYIKETKEDIDYITKEAIKECEDVMYGTYDAANCMCQKLNKFSWIDQKLMGRKAKESATEKVET